MPRGSPPDDYFRRLLETGFPRLHGIEDHATRDLYLSSYMQTYIERDIRELLRIEKRREFETFVKLCALRTGQIVNYHDLARDANVSPATVKDWLSVLEDAFLIKLLSPCVTNRTRRMTKSPKLYFLDAGLAAWRFSAPGEHSVQSSLSRAGSASATRETICPPCQPGSAILSNCGSAAYRGEPSLTSTG